MHGEGLRVRLTVRKSSVAAFEDPGFVVHLDNVGRTSLRLNPHIASNVYIYDESGQFIPAPSGWIAEFIIVPLKRNEVVLLPPGETFSQSVEAEQRPRHYMGSGARYYQENHGQGGLLLRGGKYTAKFIYVNAPGFPADYAPRDFPDVWEGRLESDLVRFTVATGAERYLDEYYPFRRPIPGGAQIEARTLEEPTRDPVVDRARETVMSAFDTEEARRTWAERQLRERRPGAYLAVDYLRRTNDPQVLPVLRRAAVTGNADIRILAARGIALFDRAEGVALLKRELENRNPGRAADALRALNELTDRHDAYDFHVPAERQQAIATYAPIH